MSKSINILDKDYTQWIKELSSRYRQSQIKAAVKVNQGFYKLYNQILINLPQVGEELKNRILPQVGEELPSKVSPQVEAQTEIVPQVEGQLDFVPQVAAKIMSDILSIPWGHHKYIIDRCSNHPDD